MSIDLPNARIKSRNSTLYDNIHEEGLLLYGKVNPSDWLFLGRDFAIRTVSKETVIGCVFFSFSKAGKFKTSMDRVPYNKLLTKLASSSRTDWGILALGRFVRTSLRSVRTATTSRQYSPVRPSRSVEVDR